MPIQIIDNFELGAAKPIDNRFVVGAVDSFYADKDDIPHKYIGLRVWDLSSGAPGAGYVWDGSAWQGEAGGSVTSTGSAGFISKFLATPTTIDDSVIFESAGLIGIGTLVPNKKLTVNGGIRSLTDGFYGNGSNITNINASNITTGSLSLSRISPGTSTYIITQGGSGPEWTDPSTITVGQSNKTDLVKHTTDNSYSNWSLITFVNTTTTTSYHELKKSNTLAIKPSDGSMYMALGAGRIAIGSTSPDASYKVLITSSGPGSTQYGLRVSSGKITRLDGHVVVGYPSAYVGSPSGPEDTAYGLKLGGGSGGGYPLRVGSLNYKSAKFDGYVGINRDPEYGVYIGGDTFYFPLTVGGDIRATSKIMAGFGSEKYPSFTFVNGTSGHSAIDNAAMGMYRDTQLSTAGLGFTVAGFLRLKIRLGGGTDFEFWNANGTNLGRNGALVNYGTYLKLQDFAHLEIDGKLYVNNSVGFGTSTFAYSGSGGNDYRYHAGSSTAWQGFSSGTAKLAVNGGIGCTWIVTTSDKRLKKNITPINKSLDKVLKLNAVEYEWDNKLTDNLKNYGFIAQEVEQVIPEVIRYYEDDELEGGKMTIHYESIIAHLTKAIQEQQEIINGFEERLKKLE